MQNQSVRPQIDKSNPFKEYFEMEEPPADSIKNSTLFLSDKYHELKVVEDQIGSPTYTVDLAKLLVEMAETDKFGTYNVTNEGYCSWAEFAEFIMRNNDKKTVINPVTTDEYYEGKEIGYAIKIGKLHVFSKPIDVSTLENFKAPQSFCYTGDFEG